MSTETLDLRSGHLSVRLLTLGSILNDVRLKGVDHSLTLGAADPADYDGHLAYFGAIVGPVANRIAGAAVPLDGRQVALVANEDGATLHGGPLGTHARHWQVVERGADHATLTLDLPDGAEGWPGKRTISAAWRVTGATLSVDLTATTDRPTYLNLANHSYWRLSPGSDLAGHSLTIAADRYTPVDTRRIPTGDIAPVAGTPFDFRDGARIGPGAAAIDHNFCLSEVRREPSFAARLTGPNGLTMTLETTEPGLQVYDAARMPVLSVRDLDGTAIGQYAGVAIEAQAWPDAPHHPGFPSIRLDPGQTYRQTTRWTFARG